MSETIPVVADDEIPLMNPLSLAQPQVFSQDGGNHSGQPADHVKKKQRTFSGIVHPISRDRQVIQIREFGPDHTDPGRGCRNGDQPARVDEIPNDGDDARGMSKSPVKRGDEHFSCSIDRERD